MKMLLKSIVLIMLLSQLTGCIHGISTEPSTETVLVDKPFIFGHGGVQSETQKPGLGWYWWSTSGIEVVTYEFKIDEPFDDLPTKKQSLIDFNSYLKLKITDPVKMVKEFRYVDDKNRNLVWYEAALKEQYRTIVRNVSRDYTMEDMLTNTEFVNKMETEIRKQMDLTIQTIGIPVKLVDLSLGAIRPNKAVMDEIDNTSAQQQRIKTEQSRKQAEDERLAAEQARANADSAYQTKMNLDPEQVTQLQVAKLYADACAKASTCIMSTGSTTPVAINPSKR